MYGMRTHWDAAMQSSSIGSCHVCVCVAKGVTGSGVAMVLMLVVTHAIGSSIEGQTIN